jgi:DNA-binding transcriptional regulator YdaS (Cro superfamily)
MALRMMRTIRFGPPPFVDHSLEGEVIPVASAPSAPWTTTADSSCKCMQNNRRQQHHDKSLLIQFYHVLGLTGDRAGQWACMRCHCSPIRR